MMKFGLPHDPGPEVPIKGHDTDISSVLCVTGYEPSILYIRHQTYRIGPGLFSYPDPNSRRQNSRQGALWGRGLTQLQSVTKTDSGITVTYSLVLLKTPWPSQSS
jgi:hypothetical protein